MLFFVILSWSLFFLMMYNEDYGWAKVAGCLASFGTGFFVGGLF